MPLTKTLLAIEALALDYSAKFPLSLVFSRNALLRYQLLFRFLLHLTHVEQALGSMWVEQKSGPWWRAGRALPAGMGGTDGDFAAWRRRVCVLRARMLAFVQQIRAFAAHEVLEPNWIKLEEKLKKCRTVDALLHDHVDFLDTCLKECMLTHAKLLRVSHEYSWGEVGLMKAVGTGVFKAHLDMLDVCGVYGKLHEKCEPGAGGGRDARG